MIGSRTLITVAIAWTLFPTAHATAQSSAPDSLFYSLTSPPSEFQYGCFGPCACAVMTRSPLTGSFLLRKSHVDPLYTYYDVLDVRWRVPDETHSITITGSGTYRRGGEVSAMEELALDLSFDGGPLQHFSSGLRSAGALAPEIRTQISLHAQYCFDSVLVVDAKPLGGAVGVGDGELRPTLSASPNPFGVSTEIQFAVAQPGFVSLGVFDLSGRRVRALVNHQWITSGRQTRAWDGLFDGGGAAPAGLYFVRLDYPSGQITRAVSKRR
jgi:hypothetical protein